MQTALDTAGNGHAGQIPEDAFPKTCSTSNIDPPLANGDQLFTVLHIEEPTFKMIRLAENELLAVPGGAQTVQSVRAYHMAALSLVSKIPRQALEDIRISQFDRAIAFLAPYLIGGPATGAS